MDPLLDHALEVVRAMLPDARYPETVAAAIVRRARRCAARTGRPVDQVLDELLVAWRQEREAEATRAAERNRQWTEERQRRPRPSPGLVAALALAAACGDPGYPYRF